MELINSSLDNNLAGSWRPSNQPTPGDRNSVYSDNAPPQIRQVRHLPKQPRDYEQTVIRAKITDPDLIDSVELLYQIVSPGQYFGAYQPKSYNDILNKPDDPHSANSAFEAVAN